LGFVERRGVKGRSYRSHLSVVISAAIEIVSGEALHEERSIAS
jgi:hypothetical protein